MSLVWEGGLHEHMATRICSDRALGAASAQKQHSVQSSSHADCIIASSYGEPVIHGNGNIADILEQVSDSTVSKHTLSTATTAAASGDKDVYVYPPVARIMEAALPENAKIANEAKECMQECVSEFISFITSEASEQSQQDKRKTLNGEDILFAMTSLGFENYGEALLIYLARYRV